MGLIGGGGGGGDKRVSGTETGRGWCNVLSVCVTRVGNPPLCNSWVRRSSCSESGFTTGLHMYTCILLF